MFEMSEEQVAWAKAMVEDPRWKWVPGMAFVFVDGPESVFRYTTGTCISGTYLPVLADEATQAILLLQVLTRSETQWAGFYWDGRLVVDGVHGEDLVAVLAEAWLGPVAFERVQERLKEARRNRVTLVNGFFDPETDILLALKTKEFAYVEKAGAMAKFERNDGRVFREPFEGTRREVEEWCQRLRDAAGW